MSIKTILICASQVPFNYGGAEILVEDLYNQLKKRGYEVDIVKLPFKWYPKKQVIYDSLAWRMLDVTESNGKKVDRVICTKYPSYIVKHPNKVVWLVHQLRQAYDLLNTENSEFSIGDKYENRQLLKSIYNIDNKTLGEAKKVFTISKNVSGRLKRYNNIDSSVLYPPVRNEEHFHNETYGDYIFVAGRLDKLKRYEIMIEAMRYTKSTVKFVIAGKGSHGNELKEMVKKYSLENKVEFKGFVTEQELYHLYANSLGVYFAPYDEDYGYITIEAFRSKKPVITLSDSGGVLEFVKDGVNGIITQNDPKSIAEIVDQLYNDRTLCQNYGEEGYKAVKEINWDYVIEQLTREY